MSDTLITRAAMHSMLTSTDIHADSPIGRRLLMGMAHFEGDDGQTFRVDNDSEPEDVNAFLASRRPQVASASAHRPAATATHAIEARDAGDDIADKVIAMMGNMRHVDRQHAADRQIEHALAARTTTSPDLGDIVADKIELHFFGKIRGTK